MEVIEAVLAAVALGMLLGIPSLLGGLYLYGDRVILRWYRAREVKNTRLNQMLRELAEKAGVEEPGLYEVSLEMPNLLSVGRRQKAVLVTTGAVELLDGEELRCVLAHEVYHLKGRDMGRRTFTAALAGLLTAMPRVALWGSLFLGFGKENDPGPRLVRDFTAALFAPPAAMLVHLAASKDRELEADGYAARLCGSGKTLGRALRKMGARRYEANPSHSLLFIVNPLDGELFNSFFDIQPSLEERLRILEAAK